MDRDQCAHCRFVEQCLADARERGPVLIKLTTVPAARPDVASDRETLVRAACKGMPIVYAAQRSEETP